jgi:tRNA(adenine34) deaminase
MNKFMNVAVEEANKAYDLGEIPIGAVIVCDDKIIAKAYNRKNLDNISVYHAEILAIIEACKYLNSWHLENCEMFITLEPCEMCKYAIAESRIKKVSFICNSDYSNNLNVNKSKIIFDKKSDPIYEMKLSNFFKNVRK